MLIDLKAPLKAGATFDATLKFEHSGDKKVTVDVRN